MALDRALGQFFQPSFLRRNVTIPQALWAGMVLFFSAALCPVPLQAQAPVDVPATRDIPRAPFKSWSLFLICNPTWLKNSSSPKIAELYDSFLGFGRATGRSHAAIWFWKTPQPKFPIQASHVDADRSVEYCSRFGLAPKESPHIVLTTEYPDPKGALGRPAVVLALNGLSAGATEALLTVLTGQLIRREIDEDEILSERWRLRLRDAFRKTFCMLGAPVKSVKVTIGVAEITGEIPAKACAG